MKHLARIVALGDSILKGVQVDPVSKRYVTRNEIGIPDLERDFDLTVRNDSHFGASTVKGERLLDRMLERGDCCDGVVMDFGGNDCDFKWAEIAADPAADHPPAVPLPEFTRRYRSMIGKLRQRDIVPILTTLPPLEPELFFDWWCGRLDQGAVHR